MLVAERGVRRGGGGDAALEEGGGGRRTSVLTVPRKRPEKKHRPSAHDVAALCVENMRRAVIGCGEDLAVRGSGLTHPSTASLSLS